MRKPTIYEALRDKLGRNPTDAELRADVERIKGEGLAMAAAAGKLRHQRRPSRAKASTSTSTSTADGNALPILDTGSLTYLAKVPFWSVLKQDGSTYFCQGQERRLPIGSLVERIGGTKQRPLVRAWYLNGLWYAWLMERAVEWHKKGQVSLPGT